MNYYHCSPTAGLTVLEARQPMAFDKPARVYMTTSLPMALMYGVKNYEYTYGYTREGQIYFDEYFPDALRLLYQGKGASLYLCAPTETQTTRIPNEVVSETAVPVVEERTIPDVYEALLEQERLGALVIHRYDALSEKQLAWIVKAEADSIRRGALVGKEDDMARYYKSHYPESWALVEGELSDHDAGSL